MTNKIYQIQIALKGFKPKIWRRILIPSDLLLSDFHKIIQTTMGWTKSHLHQFIKNRIYYTVRIQDDDFWDEMDNVDYKKMKIRISDLLKAEKEAGSGKGYQYIHDCTEIYVNQLVPLLNANGGLKYKYRQIVYNDSDDTYHLVEKPYINAQLEIVVDEPPLVQSNIK